VKQWIEIKALLSEAPPDWSVYADAFDRHGCPGSVQMDRPPSISAYLVDAPGALNIAEDLKKGLLELGAQSVEIGTVPEEDWSELWKIHFKPWRIGNRFVVRPTWEAFEAGDDDLVIVLDPGQAFGTGDHPTTRMCLELLEMRLDSHQHQRVLDLGTGTGILAMAAKLLGIRTVEATDVDPIAVEVARSNFALNQLQIDSFTASGFEDPRLSETWDVLVSNIISATLIKLAPEAHKRVVDNGLWIVSGIIKDNWPDVQAAAGRCGFTLVEVREEGDWVAAVFQKNAG
jgi:ribosomal protein L11 methyltransferase